MLSQINNKLSLSLSKQKQKQLSKQKQKQKQYKIDSMIINKYTIQSLISQSYNKYKFTTISQVFNLCDQIYNYSSNPNDKNTILQIKLLIQINKLNNKLIQSNYQHKINSFKINLDTIYPLNKPGNFGRVLQRKCKLVPKGVMQYQQNKQAKLKQIKSFINRIQHIQNKDLTDLTWINIQPQKFKFRIRLLDNNQSKKGIYFQTYQQADSVRAYLVSKYKKVSLNSQVFGGLKYKLIQSYAIAFVQKIKHRHVMKKILDKQKQQKILAHDSGLSEINLINNSKTNNINSNNNNNGIRLGQQIQNSNNNKNRIGQGSVNKRNFMTGFLDDLINDHNETNNNKGINKKQISKQIINNVSRTNQLYRDELFNRWKQLSLKKQLNSSNLDYSRSKIIKDNNQGGKFNNQLIKQKQQNKKLQQIKKSIKQQDNNPFSRFLSLQQNNNLFDKPIIFGNNSRQQQKQQPIKQSSRINKILSHSRKQQSIFTYPQRIQQLDDNKDDNMIKKVGTQKIIFRSIQFLSSLNKQLTKQNSNITNNNNSLNNNNNQNNKQKYQHKNKQPTNILLIKPIVTITICKRNIKQQQLNQNKNKSKKQQKSYRSGIKQKKAQFIFNTIIKKVFRNSQYQLSATQASNIFQTNQNLSQLYLIISVTNFLTNQQLLQTQISFNDYCFNSHSNNIVDINSSIRLKFDYKNTGLASPQVVYKKSQYSQSSLFFSFPKIDPQIINKIKTFWQSQAVSNSYYNLQDNFNLFDAVTNSSNEAQPLNWWIQLQQIQYNYLCILQSSSYILGYKLVKPMLYMIKAVKNIHFKIQKIIEMLLSIILNLGKCYYFPQQLTKINYLHRQIGLNHIRGGLTLQYRVIFEILLFQKFLSNQSPLLDDKLQRKNISISHIMLQYTYQLFSRNFGIQVLCEFWNYCSQQIQKVPLIFFLTTIALCRLLSQKLMKCDRLSQVRQVFQSKQIKSASILLNQIKYLRNKYFFKGEGLIQQIKQAFEQKPFQHVLKLYSKKLNQKQQIQQKFKIKYKKQLSSKIQQHLSTDELVDIFSKKTPQRKYVLHIYFYQLPQFDGKLVIASGKNDYQSIGQQKNRYFIIGQLSSQVYLKYTDWKGILYSGQLTFNQGFNQFKIKIKKQKSQQSFSVHYICGLLTQNQIQMIKSNKKFNHFMGPNITIDLFKDQFLKPAKQYRLGSGQQWMSQPWFRDLKNIFSHGNKLFNQVNYFMYLLITQNITPQQKLVKLRQYSSQLSLQFYLSNNEIVYKQLLYEFYRMSFISLKQVDYQCYFNDSLSKQFDAPKIIKCRFYYENGRQIKLQRQLIQYHSKKSVNYLYGDLFIDEIVQFCQKYVKSKTTTTIIQGQLKLLYSSFGQIHLKLIPIKVQNKLFYIDRQKYIDNQSIFHQISQKQPEILMTQILPSFTKISTILDYVNSNRNIDLRLKTNQSQRKVIPQSINLLKFAQNKFKNCIFLRYNQYPHKIQIPFYSYYMELINDVEKPKFKSYYMNNVKDSIKSVCTTKDHLKFSSNNKQQDQQFDKSLGLYGNLRKIIKHSGSNKVNSIFFWTDHKDESIIPTSLVCINYGYGVVRWQKCLIRKYRKKIKQRVNKKGLQNDSKAKIEYLVQKGNQSYYVRQYQIKLNPLMKDQLQQQKDETQVMAKFNQVDSDIKQGFSFLLNPMNLKDFVRSVKNR